MPIFTDRDREMIRLFVDGISNPKPVKAYTVWAEQQELNSKMAYIEADVSR